jgi:hypothetical protein
LFVQKKVIKENHTPLPLVPSVLAPQMGGCGTRLLTSFRLKQSSPLPSAAQAEGAAKGIQSQNHAAN